jgi:hypothetical protein
VRAGMSVRRPYPAGQPFWRRDGAVSRTISLFAAPPGRWRLGSASPSSCRRRDRIGVQWLAARHEVAASGVPGPGSPHPQVVCGRFCKRPEGLGGHGMRVMSEVTNLEGMHTMTEHRVELGRAEVEALLRDDPDFVRTPVRATMQEVLEAESSETVGAATASRRRR